MLARNLHRNAAWRRDGGPDLTQSLIIVIALSVFFYLIDAPPTLSISGAVAAGWAWYVYLHWRRPR